MGSGTAFKSSKEDREEVHSRYNFKCCCHACKEGWPTQEKLPRNVTMRQAKKGAQEKEIKTLDRELKEMAREGWSLKMEASASVQKISAALTKASRIVTSPNILVGMVEVEAASLQSKTSTQITCFQEQLHSTLWRIHG